VNLTGVSEHAAGALAAQRAVHTLRTADLAEGVLLLALPRDASDEYRRGFLRVLEKLIVRGQA